MSRWGRRALVVAGGLLLTLMAASSIDESRTPPEVALWRSIMRDIPAEAYETRWVDDRPFVGERALVVSARGYERTALPLHFGSDSPDGCSVSTRDVGNGVEIAIWCGNFVTTGSEF